MSSPPLLTVVIPTHNRALYAKSAIQSILSIKSELLQLVVHDTSESNDLEQFAAGLVDDHRFKYIHCPQRLTMTENHNAAMHAAEGRYVCLIGDDDTIMPEAMEAVAWASKKNIDALTPTVVANYAWPDFKSRVFGMSHAGRIYIKKKFGGIVQRSTKESLKRSLNNAAQGTDGLPKIYHGFVRRSAMEEIRARSGAFFHGSSPDVSGAIGLALSLSSFVEIDYPLTLPGASGKSNTGRSAVNTHKGALAKDAQTAKFASSGWPDEIPRFFSVETVWAHAAIETARRLDASVLHDFNFIRLYGICWLRHKEFRQNTLEAFNNCQWSKWQHVERAKVALFRTILCLATATIVRLAERATVPTAAGRRNYIPRINTIADAQSALASYLDRTHTRLSSLLK